MKSVINPALEVTVDQWVISVVRRKNHAYCVVESLGYAQDIGLGIRFYDFILKNTPRHTNFIAECRALLTKQKFAASVRTCHGSVACIDHAERYTHNDFFAMYDWDLNTVDSWYRSKEACDALIQDIEHDRELGKADKLVLEFNGQDQPNCISWIRDKLKSANINYDISYLTSKMVYQPKHIVGKHHHHLFHHQQYDEPFHPPRSTKTHRL